MDKQKTIFVEFSCPIQIELYLSISKLLMFPSGVKPIILDEIYG